MTPLRPVCGEPRVSEDDEIESDILPCFGGNFDSFINHLCMVQFYLLPSPPGQPRGQVQPFGPGGGELFEAVLSRG